MKKKGILLVVSAWCMISLLASCGNEEALSEAQEAVNNYNDQVTAYNEEVTSYNEVVEEIAEENQTLDEAIDAAQEALNQGETPFDEETETALDSAISDARSAEVEEPETLELLEELIVDEEASRSELKELTEQAEADLESALELDVPEIPEVPDYTEAISVLESALQAYEDSITSMQQVTAPTDEFVIERLQTIDTILEIEAVTEDHDLNGQLNKQGGYIGCIFFSDSQVDWSELYIEEGEESVLDVGTKGGGAVEIYSSVDDAETRDEYLATFDGTILANGSHYVVGTLVIRTSKELTATQQTELTDAITAALTEVK